MSSEREKKCQQLVDGYIRNLCKEYELDIPSEIVSFIFMFYFIKLFNIQHGCKIKVEDNTIINIADGWNAWLNTTVIGEFMNAHSDDIHTIKLQIMKQTASMAIGIFHGAYFVEQPIKTSQGVAYFNNGKIYHDLIFDTADEYGTGDIVSVTVNFKSLCLSYSVIKKNQTEEKKEILLDVGEIAADYKYQWAVQIDTKDDCIQIIDICSTH